MPSRFLLILGLGLLTASPAAAAIARVTVTRATQATCKLSFDVVVQPSPNGSGKLVTLVIPAKQAAALHPSPNESFTFQIRDGNDIPINVPLALTKQPDGSLRAQINVSDEMGRKAWAVLHVWLHPDGSGTAFSIDLGSYLTGVEKK